MADQLDLDSFAQRGDVNPEVVSRLKRIKELSSLPQSVLHILAALDRPDVDIDRVVDVLNTDPGLVATLLRVVNSAYYGIREDIRSVKQAVVRLGFDKLRSLVIAVGIIHKFHALPAPFIHDFWSHALRVGEWSRQLGPQLDGQEGDVLFVCGLLHNAGELVIRQFFKAEHERIEKLKSEGRGSSESQKAVLGVSYADIGGFLFTNWRMPKPLIQSAMYHDHSLPVLVSIPGMDRAALTVRMAVEIAEAETTCAAHEVPDIMDRLSAKYQQILNPAKKINLNRLVDRAYENMSRLQKIFPSVGLKGDTFS